MARDADMIVNIASGIGYQTNAPVVGVGGYKFLDFAR
jgi:hypothetical protein